MIPTDNAQASAHTTSERLAPGTMACEPAHSMVPRSTPAAGGATTVQALLHAAAEQQRRLAEQAALQEAARALQARSAYD